MFIKCARGREGAWTLLQQQEEEEEEKEEEERVSLRSIVQSELNSTFESS
jgi:hypothetical protein